MIKFEYLIQEAHHCNFKASRVLKIYIGFLISEGSVTIYKLTPNHNRFSQFWLRARSESFFEGVDLQLLLSDCMQCDVYTTPSEIVTRSELWPVTYLYIATVFFFFHFIQRKMWTFFFFFLKLQNTIIRFNTGPPTYVIVQVVVVFAKTS